jgi:hypothetical protein
LVPGLGPKQWQVSLLSPQGTIFPDVGRPEEDRRQLAWDGQILGILEEAAYHDKFKAKEIERRYGHFFCEDNCKPSVNT